MFVANNDPMHETYLLSCRRGLMLSACACASAKRVADEFQHITTLLPLTSDFCLQAWSDAVSMCMRFGEACDKANARSSQSKAYLGAIVVWLYAGDAQQAWQVRASSSSS
jgi:hypothetical protein